MELRSPIMSPTVGGPSASTSDEPQKAMLTLYWPTAITIAKPHIISNNSPTHAGGEGGDQKGSKWLLGWNPRGLVVVVGAVLEVPTLSACQSVLEELHRDPPLGCDQSVIKYLRILGRLDFEEDALQASPKSLREEEDEIQTNKLKNTEDIWIELSTRGGVNHHYFHHPNTTNNRNNSNTHCGSVCISDLHCCGYRQPVNLITIRYDPKEHYPTGVDASTPLATVGALMSQAVRKGSMAKTADLVLAPGARSRLEGLYVDPIVRQLCAPPVSSATSTTATARTPAPSAAAAAAASASRNIVNSAAGAGAGAASPSNVDNSSLTAVPSSAGVGGLSLDEKLQQSLEEAPMVANSSTTPEKADAASDHGGGNVRTTTPSRPTQQQQGGGSHRLRSDTAGSSRNGGANAAAGGGSSSNGSFVQPRNNALNTSLNANNSGGSAQGRSPLLTRSTLSNDQVSAMAAEMLQLQSSSTHGSNNNLAGLAAATTNNNSNTLLGGSASVHNTPQKVFGGGGRLEINTAAANESATSDLGNNKGVVNAAKTPSMAAGGSGGGFALGPNMGNSIHNSSFGHQQQHAQQASLVDSIQQQLGQHSNNGGGDIRSVISAADAITNDSFGSNNSFGGQMVASKKRDTAVTQQQQQRNKEANGGAKISNGNANDNGNANINQQASVNNNNMFDPNNAPRLRYDTYESFTEFSVILKCCNTSSRITECLFDMEETLAEAESNNGSAHHHDHHHQSENNALSPSSGNIAPPSNLSTTTLDGSVRSGEDAADVRIGLSAPINTMPAEGGGGKATTSQEGAASSKVDNAAASSSLVSPQSSMKRRRRYDDTNTEIVGGDSQQHQQQNNRSGGATNANGATSKSYRFASPSPLDSMLSPNSNATGASPSTGGKGAMHQSDSLYNSNRSKQQQLSAMVSKCLVRIEAILVPFILTLLLPLLAVVRDYSYVARLLEYRAMEVVNALSICAGKSSACGLHPAVPHSLEGTSANQRFWCVSRCFLQIGFDIALGWSLSYGLLRFEEDFFSYIRPSAWYGLYEMHLSYLDWFEGWPGGFKMNDDLNAFIAFFTRQVLYAWQFLVTFNADWDWLAFSMLGLRMCCFFGLSFGLNFVSDCCNLGTLHLRNAFHILRVVYVWFGSVIRSLVLQFRGKRVNPLRKRVDDFEFEGDQTVIGMLMCVCVLFLFPTLALHYYYLAVVRTSVWFVQEFFCATGFIVSNAPIASFMFWLLHRKEIVKGLCVTNIEVDAASGAVEMTLVAKHMGMGEAFIDWFTLIGIVVNPLQPQKLISFIISATLKPAINARSSVYPHLCANCVSPCLGSLAGQTSESS